VDRSTVSLRVMAKARGEAVKVDAISRLLGAEPNKKTPRHWSFVAPTGFDGDVDTQVDWILSRLTGDLSVWKTLTADYRIDLFCGLFLERPNRGASLSPKSLAGLGERGIQLSLDIYGPEHLQNQSTDPAP
jgi:hypothetical protein